MSTLESARETLRKYAERYDQMAGEIEQLRDDAERYRWIRAHMEWRRSEDGLLDPDSHAFVGCRFPYLANFSCAAMLDHNIDAMRAIVASKDYDLARQEQKP